MSVKTGTTDFWCKATEVNQQNWGFVETLEGETKQIVKFILIPTFINLLCIALYFSGIESAQQIVAPTVPWLLENSWREFGLLEQLQNFVLLAMFFLLLRAIKSLKLLLEKLFFFLASSVVLFIFLEEIDYGLHFYELISGEYSEREVRNWHNEETNNRQNVSYLHKAAIVLMAIWFVVLPLFKSRISNSFIRSFIPSRWFIGTIIVGVLVSRSAHFMDKSGFAIIEGVQGNLMGNTTEFRELNNYYLYLLYIM
jgi:hypothetical protein